MQPHAPYPYRTLALACLMIALAVGCSETLTDEAAAPDAARAEPALAGVEAEARALEISLQRRAERARHVVRTGSSIQAAVDAAEPGDAVVIRPGVYRESVTIDKPGITLIGLPGGRGPGVVIENPGGASNGVNVLPGSDGVRLFNFTTRGFVDNGVYLREVEDFVIMRVTAIDNGEYGLYPVLSKGGRMFFNDARGHADAGLYIGQSTDVVIRHNRASENVIGYEISNSTGVEASRNHAEDNTIGILAVLLPPSSYRTVLTAADVQITHNVIRENNHPNFAHEGELEAAVPPGSGILVVGVDDAVVEHNDVTGNDWVGIGVGSTATFGALAGETIEGIEPDPEGVVVRGNHVTGNGANPPPLPLPLPGVDLLWDGTGTDNCWENNVFDTSHPAALPACGPAA